MDLSFLIALLTCVAVLLRLGNEPLLLVLLLSPVIARFLVLLDARARSRIRLRRTTFRAHSVADLPRLPDHIGGPHSEPVKGQLLSELAVPPEIAQYIDGYCRKLGLIRGKVRRSIEEQIKLQYLFGGQDVACLSTDLGRKVIAVGKRGEPDFVSVLDSLGREERSRVKINSPRPLNSNESILPGIF